ncbi:MAG: efflux RND transporter periplasmic adaptor subunit, partial [Acetobacteraceae bacterium]|nr:efflux RND transporter periplasmic adaptor subunit [Acetobacteraceae bacterium]
MKRRTIAALGLLAAGLGAGGVVAVVRDAPGTSTAPAPAAAPAGPPGVGALGRVEPASRIRKLTQPGGFSITRVEGLFVAEGDRVEAGQLLAELGDAAQKDAALAQVEASLAEARADLAKTRAAGRPSEVAAQRARIESLAAQEAIARREAERAERLVPSGAGAFAAADRNRAAAAARAAERAEAEAQLETLSRPRPEDVALGEARVAAAEAQVARARSDAALSRVRAPIAGTVLKIYARPGDQIGNDGLLDLADLTRLDVVADVYETDLPRLRAGAPAEVVVPGEPRRFAAEVREIGWLVRRTVQAGTDPVAAVDARTVE